MNRHQKVTPIVVFFAQERRGPKRLHFGVAFSGRVLSAHLPAAKLVVAAHIPVMIIEGLLKHGFVPFFSRVLNPGYWRDNMDSIFGVPSNIIQIPESVFESIHRFGITPSIGYRPFVFCPIFI